MMLSEFAERGRTVFRELPYFPYLFTPLNTEAPWSELGVDNYDSAYTAALALRRALAPAYRPFGPVPYIPFVDPVEDRVGQDEVWFFLNGICTDENVLRLNGEALANIFGRRVGLLHNPSDGIVLDLLECLAGRTVEIMTAVSESVTNILESALESDKSKVVLIAHSQGGIISANAVMGLRERLSGERRSWLERLELYTFASAATVLEAPEVYAEHFYNRRDYVARIGVAANEHRISGRFFPLEAPGHLLNAHHLNRLVAGHYEASDGKSSQLVEYMTAPA